MTMDKEVQLQLYKIQLQQVNDTLKQSSDETSKSDLEQLRADLTQLIELTEECCKSDISASQVKDEELSTCNFRKVEQGVTSKGLDDELDSFYEDISKIEYNLSSEQSDNKGNLADLHPESSKTSHGTETLNDHRANSSRDETTEIKHKRLNEQFLDSIEALDDLRGVKCCAPYFTEWMGTQFHNAMIKDLLDKNTGESDNVFVSVLFLNPTLEAMKPCPFYLEGRCRFQDDGCRYSHGYVTDLYSLRPFVTPDYSTIIEGSKCLAKMEDGLWMQAVVDKLEDTFYHVKFLQNDVSMVLSVEDLLPEYVNDEDENAEFDNDFVMELAPARSAYTTSSELDGETGQWSLGLWEKHTRGIGLKLMQKMGYKPGGGLGRNNQGRIEPVPIVILPARKSLDYCMEIRENKGGNKTESKLDARISHNAKLSSKRQRNDVFSFLNKTLGKKVSKKKEIYKPKDMFGIKTDRSKQAIHNYSKEMLKNDEEMKKLETKIQKIRKSILRNCGKVSVTGHLQTELDILEKKLKDMKESNAAIKMHKSRMETHKNMSVF